MEAARQIDQWGAHLTTRLDKHRVQAVFDWFLLALAGLMLVKVALS